MNKKILAVDLDDTLLTDDKQIAEENLQALNALLKAGHVLAVDTGRPLHGFNKILDRYMDLFMHDNVYYLGYQGAMGMHLCTRQIIFSDSIPQEDVLSLMDEAHRQGLSTQCFDIDYLYTFHEDENIRLYNQRTKEPLKPISRVEELSDKQIYKCMVVDYDSHDRLEEFKSYIDPRIAGRLVSMFSNPAFLEFVRQDTGKGTGLIKLADYLGIPISDTVACGDERNDISMIKAAGLGVCVANGTAEARAAADYITAVDNNNGAIAEVIYKYFI